MKKQDGTEYYTNRHSCFLLQYHLVVVVKYRKRVLCNDIKARLEQITADLFENRWKCHIIAVNTDEDHIHILFESSPQVTLSTLVNNYKTVTSRLLRKEFSSELAPYLWDSQFWSDSYFIASVSERSTKMVKSYIDNQGG